MGLGNLWKKITGRAKLEKAWGEAARILPPEFKTLTMNDQRFIVTREFIDPKDNERRKYCAAVQIEAGRWALYTYFRDMKNDPEHLTSRQGQVLTKPLEIIQALYDFEAECREKGWVALKQSPPTYIRFANLNGVHLNTDGSPYEVDQKSLLDKPVFLTKKNMEDLFNDEAALKNLVLNNWDSVNKFIMIQTPKTGLEDVTKEPFWSEFAAAAMPVVIQLQELPAKLSDASVSFKDKKKFLADIVQQALDFPGSGVLAPSDDEAVTARNEAALRIIDMTILLGILRGAGDFLRVEFSKGFNISEESRELIKKAGGAASSVLVYRFDIKKKDADVVADVLGQGPNPQGTVLPFEDMLRNNPLNSTDTKQDGDAPAKPRRRGGQGLGDWA